MAQDEAAKKRVPRIRAALNDYKKGMSYREIAKKNNASTSTIHRWVKGYGLQARLVLAKRVKGSGRIPLLSKLTKEVLFVLTKMARYRTSRLYELLLPFLGSLQRLGGSKWDNKISQRTIKRELNRADIGTGFQKKKIDKLGTFVVHGVSIKWKLVGKKQLQKDYLVCICERNSGMIYFHAYKQIKDVSLYMRINEFEKRYQAPVKKIIITTETHKSATNPKRIATIIGREYRKERAILKDDLTYKHRRLKILPGKSSKKRISVIPMPGRYSSMDRLNKFLHLLADRYNELMPYNRLWPIVKELENKSYFRKATFLKKVRFNDS